MNRHSTQRQRIGPAVRRLRRDRGLTLDALADAADVSPSHLSRLERSQTLPSFPVLAKIADALGADVNEFVRLEQDVTKLDQELGEYLDLLAVDPESRADLLNTSIEARRALVERLRLLGEVALTPANVQERVRQALPPGASASDLAALSPVIHDAGLTPFSFSRALLQLDRQPGRRVEVIATASLLPITRGHDIVVPYHDLFGDQPIDPAVAHWWDSQPEGADRVGSSARPLRVIVGSSALDSSVGPTMARSLVDALDVGEAVEIAVTDRDLGRVNAAVAGARCGILEQVARLANGRQPKRVAIWLEGHERVADFEQLLDRLWDDLPAEERNPESVRSRLSRAVGGS